MTVVEVLGATAASFLVLAAMFGPLERAFPARAQRVLRPAWQLDATFFLGQYLVWSGLALWLLERASTLAASLAPAWVRAPAVGPRWALAIAVVLLGDVFVYWFHRLSHAIPFLWRFHAVHHSVEHLDWLAAHREHPVDGLLTQLVVNLPAIFLGFPLAWLSPFIVFRGLWAVFIHCNVRVPLGPMRALLGAPELHHWHHARVERTVHNFGNLAPWTDLVFGTFHLPPGPETWPLGLVESLPASYARQLVLPFLPRTAPALPPGGA